MKYSAENIGKTIKLMFDLGFFKLKIEHKYDFFSYIGIYWLNKFQFLHGDDKEVVPNKIV